MLARLGRKALVSCLGMLLLLNGIVASPSSTSAAVKPLPSPSNPFVYDDFNGGGDYKSTWPSWHSDNSGSGTSTKLTVDSRTAIKFAQTPASSASRTKFQPQHDTFDARGYRYVKVAMKNPGYPNSRIRINLHDGTKNHGLTSGFISVPTTWTDYTFDLDALVPAINKKSVKFEIWLQQTTGTYGEMLVDDLILTTGTGGTAPTLSSNVTTNSTVATPNTMFTFHAVYTDVDNDKPYAIQLVIDDTAYDMRELDAADTTYSDGKSYVYMMKLPAGSHTYYFRTADLRTDEVATTAQTATISASSQAIDVVVSQAGYSAADYKSAKVAATTALSDTSYVVTTSTGTVASGNMTYEGYYWNKHVYTVEFTSLTATGTDYRVTTNGVSSYPFQIQPNVWDGYKDEMTGFYRLQRSGVATADVYPPGYSSIFPSAKLFHAAGHLDDGKSFDGTTTYDLTGGWYDAGDYGKYAGNQWVGTEIALAYIRHADAPAVKYDNDNNGIPDLVDEAVFGSEYLIKWIDQVGGLMYDLPNQGGWLHPEKVTDNIPGTADDRQLIRPNVGGSAKAAATLASTARAIQAAVAEGDVDPAEVATLEDFADDSLDAALDFYAYVVANPTDPLGGYSTTRGGLANSKLIADVELYLLTGNPAYHTAATSYINSVPVGDLLSTNYWDMRPMALAEFYPVADTTTQAHIQALLKDQINTFLTLADDTPYGVLDQFKDFGVNEPHASYMGDLLRYYELFGDPAVLRAVQNGMYWIFGANPWNISWVSGVGTDFADFPHTRLDEEANTATGIGAIFPGAMFSGPLLKNTLDKESTSPWYQDRALYQDDLTQWRYNEYSVSIQAGMLYSIMALSATSGGSAAGVVPAELPTLSPVIGDYVRGNVTLFAKPDNGVTNIEYLRSGVYNPMTEDRGIYSATIDESGAAPFATRRIDIRGVDAGGNATYSATHYSVAPALPDPANLSLYDDFGGNGLWGVSKSKPAWVNWWNQDGGDGSFEKVTVDGRTAGKFMQTADSNKSYAKFQPWHNMWDLIGYRYVNFTMKNPGSANMQMKVDIQSGTSSYNLSGGWISVPATWTDYQWDLSAVPPVFDKSATKFSIWLRQTSGTYGELLIDEIKATNVASGTAPTLTAVGVNTSTGDVDTPFTFSATYTDADNEAPLVVELLIDGVIRHMTPADPSDTNYADGKAYTYTTKLTEGVHSFYVNTTDTTSNAVASSLQTGLSVFNTLFEDDFSDGNADGWTSTSGTWTVSGGQYRGQASSLNSYSTAGDSGWTDYTFQADVNVTNNSGGNKDAGIVFRYTDENNHYILMLKNNDKSGRKMELLVVEGGVKTSLGFSNPSVAPDTFYTYRVELDGDDIEVYQNDTLILSATDDTHASGKIGARVYANTLAIFDNVVVKR